MEILSTNDYPRVISNSWGKNEGYENEIDYIRASQIWRQFEIAPVFAAGNSGPSDNTIASPSALEMNLAVAAIDEKDTIATFSSRGIVRWKDGVILTKPNISAPGVKVLLIHKDWRVCELEWYFNGLSPCCWCNCSDAAGQSEFKRNRNIFNS